MKRILLSSLLYLGALLSAQATTVIFTSENLFSLGSLSFYDAYGNVLENGDLVRVGYFDNEAALSAGLPVSTIETAGGWHSFGELQISSPFGLAGKVYDEISLKSSAADIFNGKSIYLWVFDAGSVDEASSYGIFRAIDAAIEDWNFPINQYGLGDSVTLDLDDPSLQAIENVGVVNTAQNKASLVAIESIPEPSTVALVGVALLGLAGYRRFQTRRA